MTITAKNTNNMELRLAGRGASPSQDPVRPRVFIRDFWKLIAKYRAQVALITPGRRGKATVQSSFDRLRFQVAAIAQDFIRQGIQKGDRVALFSENSERWILGDLALQSMGAVVVPRSADASLEELEYILDHSESVAVLVETPALAKKLHASIEQRNLKLRWLLSGTEPGWDSFDSICGQSLTSGLTSGLSSGLTPENLSDSNDPEAWLHDMASSLKEDELATIVYTSGTTGQPKGVMLTQKNLGANVEQARRVIGVVSSGETYLSILPPWHAFERIAEYVLLTLGLSIVYSDRRNLKHDLKRWRPHAFAGVPRVWMMLGDGIDQAIAKLPRTKQSVVRAALFVARKHTRWVDRSHRSSKGLLRFGFRSLSMCLAPIETFARSKVLDPLLREAGLENLRHGIAISGGGSLPHHVDEFMCSLGLNLLNGYGMTETSPVLAVRYPGQKRLATVGPPVPSTEIRIVDEENQPTPLEKSGRLMVRGPQIMAGYWRDPIATGKIKNDLGWLDTGDLARLTVDGQLEITGRHKDTIVLLNGENIEPESIENAMSRSGFIQQAIVVGQDQKFLGALIVVEETTRVGKEGSLHTILRQEIDTFISRHHGFKPHERIHRFILLQKPLSIEDGTLSLTLKPRRHRITELYKQQIDSLFTEGDT